LYSSLCSLTVIVLLSLFSATFNVVTAELELDTSVDLVNRRRSELRLRRVGAILLCEDTFNQTTCICNRRDKCNSIHARLPFSTYGEGIFSGVVNFDQIIAEQDPRYLEVITGYRYRYGKSSNASHPLLLLIIAIFLRLF
ncbi:hypothetical protein TELCIR_12838, partial [Teladorsagia circumcincta]